MNEVLAERFVEKIERLVLGIEPTDALRASRVAHPIDLVLDGVPYPPGAMSSEDLAGMPDPIGTLGAIPRHNSCRHALIFKPGIKSPIAIRMYDRLRRFVPRRISYPIPANIKCRRRRRACGGRRCFPARRMRSARRVTGLRGRVTWNQSPANEVAGAMGSG